MRASIISLIAFICITFIAGVECQRSHTGHPDQIFSLPGTEKLNITFNQYSGYLTSTGQKRLHYWFVESQGNPATDPVLLWLNGGPGCSSLDGFLYEHGPLLVSEDGNSLRLNPYAWNTVANVLYIEAPVGVGYSYSNNPSDYSNDDAGTAFDNYNALLSFFAEYPEFSNQDFYISGESYGT
jgi:cathepsin A (carboxypeptidase C)